MDMQKCAKLFCLETFIVYRILISLFLCIGKSLVAVTQQFDGPKKLHIPGNANVLVHVCFSYESTAS